MVHRLLLSCAFVALTCSVAIAQSEHIACNGDPANPEECPLPEHPRPDFKRPDWVNLNGPWDFRFDHEEANEGAPGQGNAAGAATGGSAAYPREIIVPFSWGAPLSGVPDEGEIGWYRREIEIPSTWVNQRVFLVIGAADWRTTVWLDGEELGTHQGGYTPFEFELTPHVAPGSTHELVIRVDDTEHDFKLFGKQGYGAAHGIWQTPYLEARGMAPIRDLHFTPDIDAEKVTVDVRLLEPAPAELTLQLNIRGRNGETSADAAIPQGSQEATFDVAIDDPVLWTLDDPHLYEVTAMLSGPNLRADVVDSYFGMREIGVAQVPGTKHTYVALNGEPIYLQTALDQAYHPEGYYTFPSDEFMRDEILRSRRIGLNGMRIHVKIGIPRKLYWADRLGMLIMADVPNSWGEPNEEMRGEVEYALREMIRRDYNHPSIFAWVPFNETWGLYTEVDGEEVYLPETQDWVVEIYNLAKSLDPTRLVEDNSPCCGRGHTETDINSWHDYLPGWAWEERLSEISENTFPGSEWNFEDRFAQGDQPLFNSEFGNVWGYEGSTGDVDWSWDYHRAINAFRRHPKVSGWLYTEHHDVVNEWNGYWRYDRSEKFTGMDALVEGMSLRDLHAPLYVAVGDPTVLSTEVQTGELVDVPLWVSFMTGSEAIGDSLTLRHRLHGWDKLAREHEFGSGERTIAYRPWRSEAIEPLQIRMPELPGLAILAVELVDGAGRIVHRNFTTYLVEGESTASSSWAMGSSRGDVHAVTIAPNEFADASWSLKQWEVLDGLKVNGAGSGYFEYRVPWPAGVSAADVAQATFLFEASAKQLFGKDRTGSDAMDDNYMLGGGTHDPSRNPNAYPMTDEERFPSAVTVRFGELAAGTFELEDDPADHRGILSWHSQLRDRRLREAGSYGWLIEAVVSGGAIEEAARTGELVIRLEVSEALPHGLAIYGERFGRYPLDPTLLIRTHDRE